MEHIEDKFITINSDVINLVLVLVVLVLVLVLIKDHVNHQKDAHPLGIRIPRASILCQWLESDIERRMLSSPPVCLFPSLVETRLGRGDELRHSRRE